MVGEDIPDTGLADLDPGARVFVWCFRALASRRTCAARMAMGLSSLMLLHQAASAATVLRRFWETLEGASMRPLRVGATPERGLTWDEAALTSLLATATADTERTQLWLKRLGVGQPGATLRRDLSLAAGIFAEYGAAPLIAGVTIRARPAPEPETERKRPGGVVTANDG